MVGGLPSSLWKIQDCLSPEPALREILVRKIRPKDRLMTGVYGPFTDFPQRWQGKDNPQARVAEWNMPLYLAHSIADNIVPESQE